MDEGIKIGSKYKHYKNGKIYKIIAVGRHSETLEKVVIYQGLYESTNFGKNPVWVRPYSLFVSKIIYNNKEIERFKLIKKN